MELCDQKSLFGPPTELLATTLPTYEDVFKYFKVVERRLSENRGGFHAPLQAIIVLVANRVEEIWKSTSIPLISRRGIEVQLRRFFDKCRYYSKSLGRKGEKIEEKIDQFRESARVLFDIAKCKCEEPTACTCEKNFKVPPAWAQFLQDQRGPREMQIDGKECDFTSAIARRLARTLANEAVASTSASSKKSTVSAAQNKSSSTSSFTSSTDGKASEDDNWLPRTNRTSRNTQKLPALARVAERFNVSNRVASVLASAALEDAGIISSDDKTLVIDRKKISRQRVINRKVAQEEDAVQLTEIPLKGLYFDGRKDQTKTKEESAGKVRIITTVEEHVVVLGQPGDVYLGHVTPKGSAGRDIAEAIMEHLKSAGISTDHLVCVGCDGTSVNTGWMNGVVRCIEEAVGRPLQWFICMLHGNELPLRHVLEDFDGGTSGPKSYSGPLGRQLTNVLTMPVVKFNRVKADLPDIDPALLSTDQKYLLQMANAIINGHCPPELAARDPGALNMSRWLTTANRYMRLYIATPKPSAIFKNLIKIILQAYAHMWFQIKTKWECSEGARHLFKAIEISRRFPRAYSDVMAKYIAINAFFAHPENILIAMVTDERPEVRRLGVERVVKARRLAADDTGEGNIRFFKVPALNFRAKDYTELIDWEYTAVTPPPVLSHISSEALEEMLQQDEVPPISVAPFPLHTQACERHVKMVTEAASSVCGQEARDGLIRQKIKSRQAMPSIDSKKDYRPM